MRAVVADPIGGPENLRLNETPEPDPAPGEVLVKIESIGVNYVDVYYRTGLYKAPEQPVRLGNEAAGTVARTSSSSRFKEGDRVAFAMVRGTYADYIAVPEQSLLRMPDAISFDSAAAVVLQGMTAHYLTHSTFALGPQHTCLIHAAAGGTGLLLVQMAKIAGARVLATAGSSERASIAKAAGADQTCTYDNFLDEVKRFTDGAGVHVVYDSVGATTFARSLDCLRPRGLMVSFGNSSGPVGEITPLLLSQKGSLYLTRPTLTHYIAERAELEKRASDLFGWIAEGRLKLSIHKQYPLAEAAQAHRDLESRSTSGKLLLKP